MANDRKHDREQAGAQHRARVEDSDRPCEWNPGESRPAWSSDPLHAEAELSVGADGRWHLCRSCADLPEFRRYRKRTPLRPRAA